MFFSTSVLLVFCLVGVYLVTAAPVNDVDHESYLKRFGYLSESESLVSEDTVVKALMNFQDVAGIEQTGIMDQATREAMQLPRCGAVDVSPSNLSGNSVSRRMKRYKLMGKRWHHRTLTYKITKYSRQVIRRQVISTIAEAFEYWANVTKVSFLRVSVKGHADINIRFEEGAHGDDSPFDGPYKMLAHAYAPENGRVHFDDSEQWKVGKSTDGEINLLQVMTHEFGHLLGLDHSKVRAAVMAPFYKGFQRDFHLDGDDIRGVTRLYGKR